MNPSPFYPRTLETMKRRIRSSVNLGVNPSNLSNLSFFQTLYEISCIFEISLKEKTRILTKSNDLNGENLDRAT